MDVREKLRSASQRLMQGFRESRGTRDNRGKGTQREKFIAAEMQKVLPPKYAFGTGEVISPLNRTSGELDLVVYDRASCPQFLLDEGYSVFPYECVYGTVQVKTELDADELRKAYANIRSLKQIIPNRPFTAEFGGGIVADFEPPRVLGVVVAYEGGRSLDAIAAQARALDEELDDITLRPDFICVLDQGLIGPREPIRFEANEIAFPRDVAERVRVRRTGEHTWMRFCLQVMRELEAIQLRRLQLTAYLRMPATVGGHSVAGHTRFAKFVDGKPTGTACRLNAVGISRVIDIGSKHEVTYREHLEAVARAAGASMAAKLLEGDLDRKLRIFNPRNLPLAPLEPQEEHFVGWPLYIDGASYLIDARAFSEAELDDTSIPIDDLFE